MRKVVSVLSMLKLGVSNSRSFKHYKSVTQYLTSNTKKEIYANS